MLFSTISLCVIIIFINYPSLLIIMLNELIICEHICRVTDKGKILICCRCINDPNAELCSWCIIEDEYDKTHFVNAFEVIRKQMKEDFTAKTKAELIAQYNAKMSIIRSRERYNK